MAKSEGKTADQDAHDANDGARRHEGGQMWAAISHEIRTPLMGVVGMLQILARTSLSDEQRRIISTAEESSAALMRIVDDVLDFAKLETSKTRFEPVVTDLASLVEGAAELLSTAAGAKGLVLTCEAGQSLPTVMCDPLRVRQVLLNLGMNAIKFTERGRVSLMVDVAARTASAATVRFAVTDTGVGIPIALHQFLFKPFSQLTNASGGTGFGGVGLGLAICRNLVSAMGGGIRVESEEGRGTRFLVDLPLPVVTPDAGESAVPNLADHIVVTVDAGEPAIEIAARYLEAAGAQVVRVGALNALKRAVAGSAGKGRVVVLVGPEAESEDIAATAGALGTPTAAQRIPLIWLQPHAVAAAASLARRGVRLIRAYPLRRAAFLSAVIDAGARDSAEPAPYFTRTSPVAPPALSKDEAVLAARAEGRVLLVVEDNPVNQEVLRQQLAILGYDCDIAANGNIALRLLAAHRYLLILCDCHLPGMDGFELTRVIRSSDRDFAKLPIIAVTANALPGVAAHCRAAGMDDFLAKPVEIQALRVMLDGWISPGQQATGRLQASGSSVPVLPREQGKGMSAVDIRRLATFYGNDRMKLGAVLDQWVEVIETSTRELAAALAAGQWDAASAIVHRMKGSAGIAGAGDLSASGTALEAAIRTGDNVLIEAEGRRVQDLARAALDEIVAWRRG